MPRRAPMPMALTLAGALGAAWECAAWPAATRGAAEALILDDIQPG